MEISEIWFWEDWTKMCQNIPVFVTIGYSLEDRYAFRRLSLVG